ncbi:MAG: response regulator [Candidatus Glassbacteria bacterium]|nr:response regulator [Candidatus Glassbacteria bacterium]
MQFALRVNPGRDAQLFLESKVSSLRKLNPGEDMGKLDQEIQYVFTGRYDNVKKDSRFNQYFLTPRKNLHAESTSRGETIIGAFQLMDSVQSELSRSAGDNQVNQEQYFQHKIDALEQLFAADIGIFNRYFVQLFLRSTFHDPSMTGDALEEVKARFEEFLSDQDILLNFFAWLHEFSLLNQERNTLDQNKKASLSQRLEDQINHGDTIDTLKRQIVLCEMLKGIARRIIGIAEGHSPLDQVRKVLDEVYDSGGENREQAGVLEKFTDYYRVEIEKVRESLVYKRIMFLNAGHKEALKNRKQWLEAIDIDMAAKLVDLLQVPEPQDGKLSGEQQEQAKLVATFRQQIDECRQAATDTEGGKGDTGPPAAGRSFDEGMMNLLVLRLSSNNLLEEEIEKMAGELDDYRRKEKLDYQSNMVKSYNDNIIRLTQCLYYYVEINALRNRAIENRAMDVMESVRQEVSELEETLGKVMAGRREEGGEAAGSGAEKKKQGAADDTEEKDGAKAKPVKIDLSKITDPVKRAELLAAQLKDMPDSKKIKPLKELAYAGGLDTLKDILPLSQYRSEFLRNLARNTTIKIILRLLRENEETPILGIKQKQKLIDFVVGLDKRFSYLKNMEISNPATIQKIFDILIREDKDFTARTLGDIIIDEDDNVRATAVKMIAEMLDQHESSLLMKMLNDKSARVRANVIESLEATGNRNVLGILMKYKYDKDNRVRANTLKAIWNFGHKDIQESLEEMLISTDDKMKASAAWLIGEIGQGQLDLKNLLKVIEKDKAEPIKRNVQLARQKIARREEGIRILVADDDIKFCQSVCARLIREGFKATAVYNGKALLSAAALEVPDVILLDLRMPLVNGMEALKTLRTNEKTAETPVIMMSELNSTVLLKQISRAGANDYLIKPCNYERIRDKIKPYI